MKRCRLTITTIADGVETAITREGKMKLALSEAELLYREECAQVLIRLRNSTAEIVREGDYNLHLYLQEGMQTSGSIGIGGSDGEIQTFARRVAYSISQDALLLSLQYDLIISGERQKMKLRLLSRFEEEYED